MIKILWLSILFVCGTSLFAQETGSDEYHLLLTEASVFLHYSPAPVSGIALIDSAKQYAQQKDYFFASVFLEEFLQQQILSAPSEKQENNGHSNPFSFTISSGIDFNRQEFELDYIESDSVLAEQIKKPFAALELSARLSGTEENGIHLGAAVRGDKESTASRIQLFALGQNNAFEYRVDAAYLYDFNRAYPDFTFSELNSRQKASWKISSAWFFRADNETRYKKYKAPSRTTPNFIKNTLRASSDYFTARGNTFSLIYTADFNESIDYSNNDYFEQDMGIGGFTRISKNAGLQYGLTGKTKYFVYAMNDSVLSNRARSLSAQFQTDVVLNTSMNWRVEYDGQYKHYGKQTEQDPDYQLHMLSNTLKFALSRNFNLSTGAQIEYKKHFTFPGAETAYIEEQNYTGAGILLGMEYYRYEGMLISLEGAYMQRRSPHALSESWSGVNNNRSVFSFNLILQIPFADQFSFNAYASYDNDRDLDSDAGNTKSSFFSAEIQYTF